MTLFVGGIADGKNFEISKVNGRPIEEIRIAHTVIPHTLWTQADGAHSMPNIVADVYCFDGVQYRYDRTV